MLAMNEINHIKKLRNVKSLSINEISKRTGFSWSTVKKYADDDQLPAEKTHVKKGMMYEEKWGEIVLDWLMEDYALKKKLRRKNTNIFEQLRAYYVFFYPIIVTSKHKKLNKMRTYIPSDFAQKENSLYSRKNLKEYKIYYLIFLIQFY